MESSGLALSMTVVCLLLQLFLLIPALSARSGNETDKFSLLEFKARIDDDPLGLLSSWNDSAHFCTWSGITCSRRHSQRVTALNVQSWQLKGQLSPYIGNLSFLRTLRLENNSFNDEIPPEIGRLFRLRLLDFSNNKFSGEIPANMSHCSSLEDLDMDANDLSGRIPKDIGSLSELRSVSFNENNLAGEIPASVGNLSSLLYLYLRENNLRGSIPDSLGQLKCLTDFVLGQNSLTGTIPLSLYNISSIEIFSVGANKLEGSLPPDLGHTLPNLQHFFFDRNNFSGSIPSTISNASKLLIFQVPKNSFSGRVPSFASSLKLQWLIMFDNNLGYADNGDFDFFNDLFNCTDLIGLEFSNNNFGGEFPKTINNITSLKGIFFGGNQISGNIPNGIQNLVKLESMEWTDNKLTGPIPSTIGKLTSMCLLLLDGNELSGTIPSTIRNLSKLITLDLDRNNLQGSIPSSLGECTNLQKLTLAGNNLSGPIPFQLLSLPSLSIALDLSRNQLIGSIPIEVEKLVHLGRLNISENKLSGEIPKTLGSCMSMEYLYLGGNFLEGSIPEELKSLRGIREIDLSRNKLSGKIPVYFADYRVLVRLNLSFNDFEGQVPQQGVFKNVSQFDVMGNTRLCGGLSELNMRMCTSGINKNHKIFTRVKIVTVVSCTIAGLIVILFLVLLYFRSRKRSKPVLEPPVEISFPRVSYGDLYKATNGFSSANLIGVGSFGSVYKGALDKKDTAVAVKVLNLEVSHALKSFIAEYESLRIVKHRNLVKILTMCSGTDFQANDFKALVYEFMENGNLDEWLHSFHDIKANKGQEQCPARSGLNLIQRVNIAIDVASALDYLHNDFPKAIAHCDIKPSNILLDGHMVAHVGDFGLAKLLGSFSSSSCIGIRGTVGYVAPEYAMGCEVSTLGDIYSFGILLLEMFTGKRPTDSMFKDDFNLNNFASTALPEHISEIVDPMLLEEEHQTVHKSLISIFGIGVACSSAFPGERRNIGDVAAELRRIRDVLNAH